MNNSGCWLAYTTVNSKTKASEMAKHMVEHQLVACVNIVGPVESVYKWQGQLEQSEEWMLIMKYAEEQREELKAVMLTIHDYDVPELVMFPIADGHVSYLNWILASAGSKA